MIITAQTTINCSPAELFALHSDFRNRPLWHEHVISSELLTDAPIGVGSRFRTTNKSGRLTITTRETITAFDPPHQYCYELTSGPLHIISQQTFTAVPEGTQYQIQVEMRPRNWFGRLVLPFIAKQQRPHFEEAAQELKRYGEGAGRRK